MFSSLKMLLSRLKLVFFFFLQFSLFVILEMFVFLFTVLGFLCLYIFISVVVNLLIPLYWVLCLNKYLKNDMIYR